MAIDFGAIRKRAILERERKEQRLKRMVVVLWKANVFSLEHIKEALHIEIYFRGPMLTAEALHKAIINLDFNLTEVDE